MMHPVQTRVGRNIFWKGQEVMFRVFLGVRNPKPWSIRKASMVMGLCISEYLVADVSRKGSCTIWAL